MEIEISYLTPLIQVFNMPRSLSFYRDILGFEVVSDSGDGDDSSWVLLTLDGCDLMLNDQYEPGKVPGQPPAERSKWHSDTCLYLGCADPQAIFKYLEGKIVDLRPPIVTGYGMKQLYLTDPDGYSICLQCPVEP